jgi:uncharacterized protein (DUF885 family)
MIAVDRFFESYYRLRPVNATFTGVHDHDHRLPDWSPDGLAAARAEMQTVRSSLPETPADLGTLHDVAFRDRVLAAAFLDIQLAEDDSAHFARGNPSLAAGEAIFGAISLMTRPFADVGVRADAACSRLAAVPAFLAGARRSITAGVAQEWREKTLRECDGADRLLTGGISRWIAVEGIDVARAEALVAAARRAREAVDQFRGWLMREAAPAGPDRYACGSDLFDLLLARGHWCTRPRSQLLAEARAALDEALARVDERAAQIAGGGWAEVQARLAGTHPSTADYLPAYQQLWDACRERAKASDLVTWPSSPIRYVPIPIHTRDAAPFLYYLFYRSPAPFDALPVHDYVVAPVEADMPPQEQERRLRANNTSVMKLNHVVHHGAIGHHVQNYYAYRGESAIGRVAAVDCASRIGMFGGGTMAEGWACYATDLMDEAGFLTPEEAVAQQHTRARLLARAIADIGLHEGSMTFDEAATMYRDRIGMTPDAARAEACKNSMFPGTASMYWIGTEGLHQLRHARERAEGAAFSLRRFHDRVLSFGSIPVPLVARLMS